MDNTFSYEQAYKAALERARQKYEQAREDDNPIYCIYEEIFPELKESEDEKIRLQLLDFLEHLHSQGKEMDFDIWSKADCANWIIWLEKQKEQKPAEPQDYSGLSDFERAIHRGFLCAGVENVPVTIIKETAQDCLAQIKPVEIKIDNPNIQKVDPDVKVTTSDSSASGKELLYVSNKSYDIGFRDGVASVKSVEWSEEDEKYLSQAIETLEHENYSILAEKLKSLCPQPKQEWSEEDERKMDMVTDALHSYWSYNKFTMLVSWLRSLRPSWKPSEEQMKSLQCAIVFKEIRKASDDDISPLKELYEQLKKLI